MIDEVNYVDYADSQDSQDSRFPLRTPCGRLVGYNSIIGLWGITINRMSLLNNL